MVKIVGEQVYLRPITHEDTDNVVKWRNQENVIKYYIYRGPFTKEIHENWLKTKVDTGEVVQFMVCLNEGDVPVGSTFLKNIDKVHDRAEYGIFLDGSADIRGKGIGTEALRLTLKYCFETMHLHKVFSEILADNDRSIKTLEKVGFKVEAHLKDHVKIEGEYRDLVLLGILNNEKN